MLLIALAKQRSITQLRRDTVGIIPLDHLISTKQDVGDTAVALLKAGAATDKKDADGNLALDLAPDREVRKYIERMAENEGIELS